MRPMPGRCQLSSTAREFVNLRVGLRSIAKLSVVGVKLCGGRQTGVALAVELQTYLSMLQ